MTIKVNALLNNVGDEVNSAANDIRTSGEEMYTYVMGLPGLTGEIRNALERSQQRWSSLCDEFARAEQQFGNQCHDTYSNTMATDLRCSGYF